MAGNRQGTRERNFLKHVITRVAIVAGGAYQLVVEQKLFLHTFIGWRETGHPVPVPPVGYWNAIALKYGESRFNYKMFAEASYVK